MTEAGSDFAMNKLGSIESVALELIGQLTEIRSPNRWREWSASHTPVLVALRRHLPESGIRRRLTSLSRSKQKRFEGAMRGQ